MKKLTLRNYSVIASWQFTKSTIWSWRQTEWLLHSDDWIFALHRTSHTSPAHGGIAYHTGYIQLVIPTNKRILIDKCCNYFLSCNTLFSNHFKSRHTRINLRFSNWQRGGKPHTVASAWNVNILGPLSGQFMEIRTTDIENNLRSGRYGRPGDNSHVSRPIFPTSLVLSNCRS